MLVTAGIKPLWGLLKVHSVNNDFGVIWYN